MRNSVLTYALGVMKLQNMVAGVFRAVALSKPDARKVANGCASMLGVRHCCCMRQTHSPHALAAHALHSDTRARHVQSSH